MLLHKSSTAEIRTYERTSRKGKIKAAGSWQYYISPLYKYKRFCTNTEEDILLYEPAHKFLASAVIRVSSAQAEPKEAHSLD